jgi:hypothetical protein
MKSVLIGIGATAGIAAVAVGAYYIFKKVRND